ncbi:forkhead box protein P1 isoform X2 [Myripristis murdjan]|uniref:forkhead box protein P1 isoform X2 n=1 Tax=Myripristis murdjan TaxID=586833 RepID=UPI00117618B8|nr:forkhead box protein P1-like isoform X2 [Myripristis murdjan]
MPETAVESLQCGKQPQVKPQHEKGKQPGELCPPPAPPASPSPPPVDSVSQSASGSQIIPLVAGSTLVASIAQQSLVQQYWADVESRGQKQFRPSVLRQTTSRRHHENGVSQASVCKAEAATGHRPLSPSPSSGSSPRQLQHSLPLREDSPKQSSMEARLHNGSQGSASVLFARGLCRWPGCNAASEDFSSFLKHLHSEHSHGERSIAQWRVQQDMVQYLESQLILEKQKLFAMQLHLHLSEHKYTYLTASDWPHSLPLLLPQPQAADGDGVSRWAAKHPEEFAQHGYWAAGTAHLLPDLVPSIECYKNHNIRPPYTYAYLIRWSILESPDKQRTLNEIYNWFTTMFFYFRYNTATWKNAVRHNLSLHKCFVRVEGGKGAVWTVDETEYQRRKGQKFHRDCPVKWLTSYSHFCPEES